MGIIEWILVISAFAIGILTGLAIAKEKYQVYTCRFEDPKLWNKDEIRFGKILLQQAIAILGKADAHIEVWTESVRKAGKYLQQCAGNECFQIGQNNMLVGCGLLSLRSGFDTMLLLQENVILVQPETPEKKCVRTSISGNAVDAFNYAEDGTPSNAAADVTVRQCLQTWLQEILDQMPQK